MNVTANDRKNVVVQMIEDVGGKHLATEGYHSFQGVEIEMEGGSPW